jgi:hypothetical protein
MITWAVYHDRNAMHTMKPHTGENWSICSEATLDLFEWVSLKEIITGKLQCPSEDCKEYPVWKKIHGVAAYKLREFQPTTKLNT